MNRRSFLRLFAATTGACVMSGNMLHSDTSHDRPTAITIFSPKTADEMLLWVMAQKLYDYAYFCASLYQVPMKILFGKDLTIQDYYDSLLAEYQRTFKMPLSLDSAQLEYAYCGAEIPQTLELKARFV